MLTKQVTLSNLINDCVILAQNAGRVISSTAQIPISSAPVDKAAQVAETDQLIRQTYMHNLSQLYPGLSLICQGETPTKSTYVANDPFIHPEQLLKERSKPALALKLLQESAVARAQRAADYQRELEEMFKDDSASIDLTPGNFEDEYNLKDIAVWIDPIDGSKALADGDLEHVTNLIGITVRGRPKVGIMHKPFSKNRSATRTYVGSVEAGLFYFDHSGTDSSTSKPNYVPPFGNRNEELEVGNFKPQLCTAPSFQQQESLMDQVLADLQPLQVNRIKGPGNKFLHLTDERSDFFLNLVPGYEMWDICASEAIFSSRFGILTDAKQKPLFYDNSKRSFSLWNGIVAARNSDIYFTTKKQYENKAGKTLGESQTQIRREIHKAKLAAELRASTQMQL